MKTFEINITPGITETNLLIDGQEIRGITQLSFSVNINPSQQMHEITLEFEGIRMDEDSICTTIQGSNGEEILEPFVQKVRVISATFSGEINDYPIGG